MPRINLNALIVIMVGVMGWVLTGTLCYAVIKNVAVDINPLTTIVSSIVTGLLGIVVGAATTHAVYAKKSE